MTFELTCCIRLTFHTVLLTKFETEASVLDFGNLTYFVLCIVLCDLWMVA